MFKNLIVYRIAPGLAGGSDQLEEALAKTPFQECGATQEKGRHTGVPPRGDAHGPLAESVGGQWMLRFMAESKMLPGHGAGTQGQEKAALIEQQTGRKPGKKEGAKDEARLDLLPMAFTKQARPGCGWTARPAC